MVDVDKQRVHAKVLRLAAKAAARGGPPPADPAAVRPPKPALPARLVRAKSDRGEPPPRPMSEWPLAARWAAKFRSDADTGLGDTVARNLAMFGADALKRVYRRLTGRSCGCTDRQAALNRVFPYPKADA